MKVYVMPCHSKDILIERGGGVGGGLADGLEKGSSYILPENWEIRDIIYYESLNTVHFLLIKR